MEDKLESLPSSDDQTQNQTKNKKIFVALSAAFGGLSPNLITLAVDLRSGIEIPNVSYLFATLIMAFAGAIIALIWKEKDLKRAFYLGIGFPALIQAATANSNIDITQITQSPSKAEEEKEDNGANGMRYVPFTLISSAMAQPPPTGTQEVLEAQRILYREVIIAFGKETVARRLAADSSYEIWFSSPNGKHKEKREVNLSKLSKNDHIPGLRSGDEFIRLEVPDFAHSVYAKSNNAKGPEKILSENRFSITIFRVDEKTDFWSGFWRGLGFRWVSRYKITMEKIAERKRPIGRVVEFNGQVRVNENFAEKDMPLYIEDKITTEHESKVLVELTYEPGKKLQFTLMENARVEINEVLSLLQGEIEIEVQKGQLQIITPKTSIGVQG